ncbi:MAG: DUF1998 domain-containing protein, partial [Firmicutes bacterium]|nr:DUF1998 domain-containing protein [Bacillota bacterium]
TYQGHNKKWGGITVSRCFISVLERVDGYVEKVYGRKTEVAYEQPLMRYFVTSGVEIFLRGLNNLSHGAVAGLTTALENAYTFVYPCDTGDFGVHAWTWNNEEGRVCFFDNAAGGIGLTWPLVDFFERMIGIALDSVENCPSCNEDETSNKGGCVKCIASVRPYGYLLRGDRQETIRLLREISAAIREQPAPTLENGPSGRNGFSGAIKKPAGYGQTMIAEGSLVFTGRCQEGLITGSSPYLGGDRVDRIYEVLVNGAGYKFLGSSLSLLQGQLERWCTNCGEESIDLLARRCPECGELL